MLLLDVCAWTVEPFMTNFSTTLSSWELEWAPSTRGYHSEAPKLSRSEWIKPPKTPWPSLKFLKNTLKWKRSYTPDLKPTPTMPWPSASVRDPVQCFPSTLKVASRMLKASSNNSRSSPLLKVLVVLNPSSTILPSWPTEMSPSRTEPSSASTRTSSECPLVLRLKKTWSKTSKTHLTSAEKRYSLKNT